MGEVGLLSNVNLIYITTVFSWEFSPGEFSKEVPLYLGERKEHGGMQLCR